MISNYRKLLEFLESGLTISRNAPGMGRDARMNVRWLGLYQDWEIRHVLHKQSTDCQAGYCLPGGNGTTR